MSMIKSKQGMLGNIIVSFIVIFIGVQFVGVISQMVDTSGCNSTIFNSTVENITYEPAPGATDSFGGGGASHFGGYDGKVEHKSFGKTVAQVSIVKITNSPSSSICALADNSPAVTMLNLVPGFFAIMIMGIVLIILYTVVNNLREVGL